MIYKVGKHEVELYDSVHNLPILRFQRFNKYLMQSCDIGNTFEDFDTSTQKTVQFLKKKMLTEAINEMENRRQTVFNAFNEFTPMGKALAVLVKRINKEHFYDFSPNSLDRVLVKLDNIGFSYSEAIEKVNEVKKKSIWNWAFIFGRSSQRTETRKK